MANRRAARCPNCESVMKPVYRKGPRGKAFIRLKDVFVCFQDGTLARGRRNVKAV